MDLKLAQSSRWSDPAVNNCLQVAQSNAAFTPDNRIHMGWNALEINL
jgi:hypothetical protein